MSVWLRYVASHPDLIRSIRVDEAAAQRHYETFGRAEGRSLTGFDPLRYGASYSDLVRTFGTDESALERHYITVGFYEGRDPLRFDPLGYAASNPDVYRAFGKDTGALTKHYFDYGAKEGRSITTFDPVAYAAANRDVLNAFGSNTTALTQHYLDFGIREGRATGGSFSPIDYLLSYKDLVYAGLTSTQASKHYLDYGIKEGRAAKLADDQTTHVGPLGRIAATTRLGSADDVDWFQFSVVANWPISINVLTTGIGTATANLVGARIDLLSSFGNRIATHVVTSADVTSGLRFASFSGAIGQFATYYIAVTAPEATDFRLSVARIGPDIADPRSGGIYTSDGRFVASDYNSFIAGAVPSILGSATPEGAVLIGGPGADSAGSSARGSYIDLGSGIDTVVSSGAILIDLAAGIASRPGGIDDRVLNVENVTAFNGDMRVLGSDVSNVITTELPRGVIGIEGADYVDGRGGDDTLSAGGGNDTLLGGLGNDVLTGGNGADRFIFDSALGPNNIDQITDFVSGTDKIGLVASIFGATLTAANFAASATATTADQRILYDQATGRLFYDADGNGAGPAVLFAQLGAGTPLVANDLLVI